MVEVRFAPLRRSIPACAGEAIQKHITWLAKAVYPRVCGGSRLTEELRIQHPGLSPRVRGKLASRWWW